MTRLVALMLLLVCTVLAAAPLHAQERHILYGYDREFPPFSQQREATAEGFDVELLEVVLQGTQYRILPRPMKWENVLMDLSAGDINISSGMIKTRQRLLLFSFPSRPTLPLKARFFMKDFKRVANIDQLKTKKVGVKTTSLYETMLKERGGMIVVPFETDLEALKALHTEQVDAWFGADRVAFFLLGKVGLDGISPVGTPLAVTNVYYAVYREDDQLLQALDQGLLRVRQSGEYDRIFRKWFVTELTDDELRQLLDKAKEAAAFAYAPYSNTPIGAAVLGRTGTIYTGCNVENGLPPLNASALEVAVHNAVSSGEADFRAAVSVMPNGRPAAPNADDRRLLYEFGPEILVITEPETGRYETPMITQLLPLPREQEPETIPDVVE